MSPEPNVFLRQGRKKIETQGRWPQEDRGKDMGTLLPEAKESGATIS